LLNVGGLFICWGACYRPKSGHAEGIAIDDMNDASEPRHFEPDTAHVTLSKITYTLREYSPAIMLATLTAAMLFVLVACLIYVIAPAKIQVTLPFRLDFEGASSGHYPNGLKFSSADIIDTPVLAAAFSANGMNRFMSFQQFSRSIYVVEANRDYELLTLEYQSRLSDPKLTPVDRERIEREFEQKRSGMTKSDFALTFVYGAGIRRLPSDIAKKTLGDILGMWARRAVVEKKILQFSVPVLTTKVLDADGYDANDPMIAFVTLRHHIGQVLDNVNELMMLPGIEMVRTSKTNASLTELRLKLEDLVRFQIDPLIARSARATRDSATTIRLLEANLAYSQARLDAMHGREAALRSALALYDQRTIESSTTTSLKSQPNTPSAAASQQETVMPQLSDTFLDRVVELANRNADREYRQRIVNDLRAAALAMVPAEEQVAFLKQTLDSAKTARNTSVSGDTAQLRQSWSTQYETVKSTIEQIGEIYTTASRQLNPITELLTITGPASIRVQRAVSLPQLSIYGIIVILMTLLITAIISLLHNRIREEQRSEAATRPRVTAPT
jgi:hypothetical protein